MASWTDDAGSLSELAEVDRFGDRIHLWLAAATLITLPMNGWIAGLTLGPLFAWSSLRTLFWRKYLPTGPGEVLFPAIAWLGFLAISLTWSPDFNEGWHQLWSQRWLLVVPMLWPLMDRWRLLLVFILLGCLAGTSLQTMQGFREWSDPQNVTISGFNSHPRTVAVWSAGAVVGVLGLYLAGTLRHWTWLLACIPPILAIVMSGSRGGLLAVIIAVPVTLGIMFLAGFASKKRLLGVLLVAVIGVAGLLTFQNRIVPQFQKAVASGVAVIADEQASDIRIVWWRSCLRQWRNHPLTGYGLGGTATALAADPLLLQDDGLDRSHEEIAVFNQPHSVYFQVLLEGGLVGVLLLTVLLGALIRVGLQRARSSPLGAVGVGGVIVWMVTAGFDAWHTQPQPLAFLWIAALFCAFDPTWTSAADEEPLDG
jgi:O-antigen ligase